MAGKFRNKFRIESTRATWWDYSWNGYYFITICTYNKRQYFGRIINHEVELSSIGQIAHDCWHEIPNHFPFVKLGAFIVMPNHIHGVIIIDRQNKLGDKKRFIKLQNPLPLEKNKFGPQSKNLPSIVRGYKIGVKKLARRIEPDFEWQRRYDDNIIQSFREYIAISTYIINNPSNWNDDENFI